MALGQRIGYPVMLKATNGGGGRGIRRCNNEEELRRLTADLRDADRRKDEFLATLSDELRNPMAPMRSALDIMRMAG